MPPTHCFTLHMHDQIPRFQSPMNRIVEMSRYVAVRMASVIRDKVTGNIRDGMDQTNLRCVVDFVQRMATNHLPWNMRCWWSPFPNVFWLTVDHQQSTVSHPSMLTYSRPSGQLSYTWSTAVAWQHHNHLQPYKSCVALKEHVDASNSLFPLALCMQGHLPNSQKSMHRFEEITIGCRVMW